MTENILAIALGALTLTLGLLALSPMGLPLWPNKALKGPAAKTIGAILLALGAGFFAIAYWSHNASTPGGA